MKKAGVPVLDKVAAIFLPTMPDLPMPHTTTRPFDARTISTASSKFASSRAATPANARDSISKTCRADSIWFCRIMGLSFEKGDDTGDVVRRIDAGRRRIGPAHH